MKPLLSVVVALFLAGCATDTPPAQEVRDQFQSDFPGRSQSSSIDHPERPSIGPAPR